MAETTSLKGILRELRSVNSTDIKIALAMDAMFRAWNQKSGPRDGLHASSILADDTQFCYREHILGIFYRKILGEYPVKTLRIFLNGWSVHQKWQNLYEEEGIARSVEGTRLSEAWWLYLTPDAIIDLFGKQWVVEIKSMNSYQFGKLRVPPENAVRQSHFYMHFTGIPQAIVLVENKDTQDVKLWSMTYDPEKVIPFLIRMDNIHKLVAIFEKTQKLPKRLCASKEDRRAKECPLAQACFAMPTERETFRLPSSEVKYF